MINSNKSNNHVNDLYGERKRIVNWFENNHPDKFDLYGYGWNEFSFRGSRYFKNILKSKILKSSRLINLKHLSIMV